MLNIFLKKEKQLCKIKYCKCMDGFLNISLLLPLLPSALCRDSPVLLDILLLLAA